MQQSDADLEWSELVMNTVNTKKKKIMTLSTVAVLTAVMASIGVVLAVMTKTVESRANQFSFSNAEIELKEPEWNPEDEKIVYPGAVYSKNPQVENTGENDLYVYLEVRTPVGSQIKTVETDQQGKEVVKEAEVYDLLEYKTNDGWELLIDSEPEDGYHVRIYGYTTPLPPNQTTGTLFDEVMFSENILEGEPEVGMSVDMPVTAYAIQSKYLKQTDDTKSALREAFETYIRIVNNQQ